MALGDSAAWGVGAGPAVGVDLAVEAADSEAVVPPGAGELGSAMKFQRIVTHLMSGPWHLKRAFPAPARQRIETAIARAEGTHRGQIRFAVEHALELQQLLRWVSARERAIEVFSQLRVWDTAENNGVLIYLLLADHDVEILADRGISNKIPQACWEAICHDMESAFRDGQFEAGVLRGIERVSKLLAEHFPPGEPGPNELPDAPVFL